MFTLAFEYSHRVLLARFAGIFTPEDITGLDRALIAFVAREGAVRSLLDLSGIEGIAVPHTLLAERARLPPILPNHERVIVAPHPEAHDLVRAYASQKHDFGHLEPRVVLSLWDAYQLLGLERPDFRTVPDM
jgi:hypothetical protein